MITVVAAPPYLTVQDDGRRRSRSAGVPRSGAMDAFALAAANALVGNALTAAALEWGLAGGSIRFDAECVFALAGATAAASLGGQKVAPLTTSYAPAGSELVISQIDAGRFLYVAVRGGLDAPIVLHSRSTYLPGRFGGVEGRLLRRGDVLRVRDSDGHPSVGFHAPADLIPAYAGGVLHITRGPQAHMFTDDAWAVLLDQEFRVSHASDRTGYRLEGASIPNSAPTLPSEAGAPGALQVPGDGKPIALMADAPTVGGYPKMAAISEADLPILAQRQPGETVRFELVTIEQSQRAGRRRAAELQTIRHLAESSLRRA